MQDIYTVTRKWIHWTMVSNCCRSYTV